MRKTVVVIDSTCYMSKEEVEKRKYKVIPLSVNFDNVVYKEQHDNGEQAVKVFKEVFEMKKLPRTSQPSPSEVMEVFKELASEGYEKIITFHISEELSGTVQGVKAAAKQFIEESGLEIEINVVGTKTAAQVSGIIANEIDDIVKTFGDISLEEINKIVDHYSQKIEIFFFVDDLNFLHYGGRISQVFAATGKILGLSPILTLNNKGGIEKYKVERTQKKGIKNVLDKLESENYDSTDDIILMTAHIQAEKKARKLLKSAQEMTNANLIKSEVSNIGIVIGNHLGPGSVGIGWVPKYKRAIEE